jgi:hypothetical protein
VNKMMDREKLLNDWMDWCFHFLLNETDDEYDILCYGVKSEHDLFSEGDHVGVAEALVAIKRALYMFFKIRQILPPPTERSIPKVNTSYVGDLVDEGGNIALPVKGAPKALLALYSLHGYPEAAPWGDYSAGFRKGPYLSHNNSDPKDKCPYNGEYSENKVPIVETAEVVRAMEDPAFPSAHLFLGCFSAHSARMASKVDKQMFTWGANEGSVAPNKVPPKEGSEEEPGTGWSLHELADVLGSIKFEDYIVKYMAFNGSSQRLLSQQGFEAFPGTEIDAE